MGTYRKYQRVVQKYNRKHRRPCLQAMHLPRFLIQIKGKIDAKKARFFLNEANEIKSLWEEEKKKLLGMQIEREAQFCESLLYPIREESRRLLQEFEQNRKEMERILQYKSELEEYKTQLNMRRYSEVTARANYLMNRNPAIMIALEEIDEVVTSISLSSSEWLRACEYKLQSVIDLYRHGAIDVQPNYAKWTQEKFVYPNLIHDIDIRRRCFLESIEGGKTNVEKKN